MNAKAFLLALAVAATATGALLAGEADHDRARRLREAGDIVPLERVIESARQIQEGQILEVELEHHDGSYHYEVELLTREGQVESLLFDASNGAFLGRERD